jgi:hypothetical protein
MPSNPPRKMHPAQIKAVVREVMVGASPEILRKQGGKSNLVNENSTESQGSG